MSESLPRWNIDIKVVDISPSVGRGIVALRNFRKKEVVGIYDGHRCDDRGIIRIYRDSVNALFHQYPMLDRTLNGSSFKQSHSVSIGRTHLSGLVIDGYPLCHPILDNNIDSLGRFALCNSASSDATANVKLKWVPAPDLPVDVINNLSNCECFVVCTRPVKKGEEFLWNYPFAHHMSPGKISKVKLAKKTVKCLALAPAPPCAPAPAPAPAVKPAKKQALKCPALDSDLDPDCICPGGTKCKMGFCWFLGGRVVLTRRR
jgi:hypothetical protein